MKPKAYIVYCWTRTLLDRDSYPYPQTEEMLRAYPDCRTSLGPWTEADIVDFFTVDYGRDESWWPLFKSQTIADYFQTEDRLLVREWGEPCQS